MTEVFLGIDIGGSHIGVGCVSAADGSLLCSSSTPVDTYSTFEGLLELIIEITLEMIVKEDKENCHKLDIISIGIGCPGQCKDGILVGACIFPFKNVHLADAVSSQLTLALKSSEKIPTVLLNDADAAIVAEVWGRDSKDLYRSAKNIAMITIGTGLGLGLVLDGKLYQGSRGLIEGGHTIIDNNNQGRHCSCGQVGCVEAYSSAKSASIRMFEADIAREKDRAKMGESYSVDKNNLTDGVTDGLNTQYSAVEIEMGDAADVFTRASRGDEGANMIMNETAEGLSILCINICRILDPEFIIIGGGMSLAGDALLQPIQKYFKERSWTVLSDDVRIVIASNSEDAGIVGAALHAFACFARTRENLAFETMILDYSPSSSSVMRISKSVEVLNYMHSNRDSASNKNILDAYHNLGDDTIMTAPSVAINEIKHDINQYQITGKTTAKSSDNEIHKENNKLNNSISSISSSKNLSMIFFVSGALSLFSACALGVSTVLRNSNERECVKNDFEIPNLIHYSAFVCQICAGSYFLYNSQKEVF